MIISAQYFKDRTIVTPNGCWIWTRSVGGRDYRIGKGYGKLGLNGKIVSAHRVAYQVFHGAIAEGMHVCHSCDETKCCNPDHLFLGSNTVNRHDSIAKQRHAYGTRHGQVKLTAKDIVQIRALARCMTGRELAKKFGVCPQQISRIIRGTRWKLSTT